jgi:triosephosphate isomerase
MSFLLAANWKMHGDAEFAAAWMGELDAALGDVGDMKIALCAPSPLVGFIAADLARREGAVRKKPVFAGAQDCSAYESGAHTGEVAAALLRKSGCEYVIIGHSERRAMGEDEKIVAEKIKRALAAGLRPIICVGESAAQRESGDGLKIVQAQVRAALVDETVFDKAAIAFEPVWAIGAGAAATPDYIAEVHRAIRGVLRDGGGGDKMPLLYGGSVSANNAAAIFAADEVGGALVGGASLSAASFAAIAKAAMERNVLTEEENK